MALVLILVLSLIKVGSGQWQVIGPDKPIQVSVGEDAAFFCFLSPETSAENMEVRFFRDQFSAVIHLYRNRKDQDYMQMATYRGRTEFIKDSIVDGKVFLRLKNITALDAGLYGCWFNSHTYYEGANWELQVSGLGSTPLVSILEYVNGGLQLLCQSSGWFPQPTVKWKGTQGHYVASDTKMKSDINGLFSVDTSLTVENAGNISCSIQHPDQIQEVESRIWIRETFFQPSAWRWVCITLGVLCSVLCVAITGVILYYTKSLRKFQARVGELQKKLDLEQNHGQAEWREAKKHAVEVTLDPDTAHPQLYISKLNAVTYRKTPKEVPCSGKRFVGQCVVAYQGFQAGKHYWEVDVGHNRMWSLGVCQDDVARDQRKVTLSPSDGYWVLKLEPEHQYFTFDPQKIVLSLKIAPTRVGIFLDYESGIISFFNINDQALIYTLKHQFEGLLRPFIQHEEFNDKYEIPIVICPVPQKSEREASSHRVPTSPDIESQEPSMEVTTPFISTSDAQRLSPS